MDAVDHVIRIVTISLFSSFIPFSVISYLRWQLPDKQKRFVELMKKCKWTKGPQEPAWMQAVRQRCCIWVWRLEPSRRLDRDFAPKKPETSRLEVHNVFETYLPLRQPQAHGGGLLVHADEYVVVEDPEHFQELHD